MLFSGQTPQKNFGPRILYSFYVEFLCLGKLRTFIAENQSKNNKIFKLVQPNELNQHNTTLDNPTQHNWTQIYILGILLTTVLNPD